MKKEALLAINDVAIYPVITFVIYGLFFAAVFVYVIFMSKKLVHNMKALPLEEEPTVNLNDSPEQINI